MRLFVGSVGLPDPSLQPTCYGLIQVGVPMPR
jgi:hypothetical protein